VCQRLFLIGIVLLGLGIQFRLVKSFELNERASQFVAQRIAKPAAAATTTYVSYDPLDDWPASPAPPAVTVRSITPPRWLGWSFISVGVVLILTCPCFRS
jgi:hypothetical protein